MRASRADLWWVLISWFIGVLIVFIIEYWIVYWDKDITSEYPMYFTLICLAWWIFCILKTIIDRFHDLNKSGWWATGLLLPPFNIWLLIELLFFWGTNWANRFWVYKNQNFQTSKPNTNLQDIKQKTYNPTSIPTYNWQNKNFEQKKYSQTTYNSTSTNSTKSNYEKKIDQINNSQNWPKVYEKKPQVYKTSWDYNPYSLSWK